MRGGWALLVALVLIVPATGACSSDGTDPASGQTPSDSAATGVPAGVAVTDLDDRPVGLARVGTIPWAALPDRGVVLAAHDLEVEVGELPLRLVTTPAGVWVSVIGDGTVVRIDPGTGDVDLRARLRPSDSEPEGLAWDGRRVWVVDQAGNRVIPLDPASGRLGTPVEVGQGPRLVAAGADGVYVTSYVSDEVSRVAGGRATTRDAGCLSPQGLAEAAGIVWVACTGDGQVVGLDGRTLAPVVRLPDLTSADAVVADGDTVYVVGQQGPTVWTIDAGSREVVSELVLDTAEGTAENVDATLVGDHVWVSHPDARRLYDVPLRLLAG